MRRTELRPKPEKVREFIDRGRRSSAEALGRGAALKVPRAAMRRPSRRKVTAAQREAAFEFKVAVCADPCAVCRRSSSYPLRDAHHVVSAQWLRANAPENVYDARNALPLCRDCHERHESASRRVPLTALTAQNLEFAREVLGAAAGDYLARRYAP